MSIALSDYLKPNIGVPVDYRQGPFATTTVACATVNVNYRYKGLTVLITNGSTVDEYWWKAGTADSDLVLKTNNPVTASSSVLGGIKIGTGLSIDSGTASVDFTGYATNASVTSAISALVNGAGASLDTLNELASALGNDASFSTTVTTALGNRLRIDVDTQALTTTQKSNVKTNLGLATVAFSGSYSDLTGLPTAYSLPTASSSVLGGVKVGTGLSIDVNGILSSSITQYSLPTASSSVLGGVKVGTGLSIDVNGILSSSITQYSLPTASTSTLGGVKVDGTTITINASGVISGSSSYTLPTASSSALGGVKVGTGLSIDVNGILSSSITQYSLPTASTSTLGGVKVDGTTITINASGVISGSSSYSLPTASSSVLGGIKIGTGLSIDNSTGTASVDFTGYATTASVTSAISGLVNGAGASLDTLNELATALGNDASFSTTVTTALGNRLRIDVDTQALTTTQKSNVKTNLGLATVAFGGSYSDLTNKITSATNGGVQFNTNANATELQTIYNTATDDAITCSAIGGLTATLASTLKTKTIVQLLDLILFPLQLPTYTVPTFSITNSVSGSYAEIGTSISPTLTALYSENDGGAATRLSLVRNGTEITGSVVASPTIYAVLTAITDQFGFANPNTPNNQYRLVHANGAYTILSGSNANSWTFRVNHAAGSAKKTSANVTDSRTAVAYAYSVDAPIAASSTISGATSSISGIYPYFWGVGTSSAITAATIASKIASGTDAVTTVNKVVSDPSGNIQITFNATVQYIWFALPAQLYTGSGTIANKAYWGENGNATNRGTLGTDSVFMAAPVSQSVTTTYWSNITYNIYISKVAATTGTSTYTFSTSAIAA